MIPQQQKNGESSMRERPLTTSHSQSMGLGLGLNLTDTFTRASFADHEEDEFDEEEGDWEDRDGDSSEEEEEDETLDGHGKGKAKVAQQTPDTRTPAERLDASRRLLAAEQARATISNAALAAKGIRWDENVFFNDEREFLPVQASVFNPQKGNLRTIRKRHDLFKEMANIPELFMELAKYLHIKDLLSLYAISIDFHETINGHMSHCMRRCAEYMAPESASLYLFKFYNWLCMEDPAGRRHPQNDGQARRVPSLKWLQMVVHREKTIRDILACMARQGHRMPEGMALSLKKSTIFQLSWDCCLIWILSDEPYSVASHGYFNNYSTGPNDA